MPGLPPGPPSNSGVGGEICFRWQAFGPDRFTGEAGGMILEASRPDRFVFQWRPDNPSYATIVEIGIESVEGGNVSRVDESGYQDTPSGLRPSAPIHWIGRKPLLWRCHCLSNWRHCSAVASY